MPFARTGEGERKSWRIDALKSRAPRPITW
jgi:hypothetical protein